MRDPESRLVIENQNVRRPFERAPKSDHFLHSPLALNWAAKGLIPTYEWLNPTELVAERLPFVSYPHEWCDAQLHIAAVLTLQLQRDAVVQGFDLKDGSAWNIIFRGTTPLFCDLGSFQQLAHRIWWAGGQFARHFLVPLWLAKQHRLHINQCFKLWRDGVPSPEARRLLGPARFLTRYWPLVASGRETERPTEPADVATGSSGKRVMRDISALDRQGLHTSFSWMLDGLRPLPARNGGPWVNYIYSRDHYEPAALEIKRQTIANWLHRTQPGWVADFGANTGEFSFLAAEAGAEVVSLDSDHDAVERIFTKCPDSLKAHVYPIVATLDDLGDGRGWGGNEFEGLASRLHGRFDLVLMLALLHHLMVAASIPICEIAAFAAQCTRRFLIVELLEPSDPQLVRLSIRHGRDLNEFTLERQLAAFLEVGFVVEAEVDLAPTPRRLFLLCK